MKKRYIFLLLSVFIMLSACQTVPTISTGSHNDASPKERTEIVIDIKGEIRFPGIYALKEGSLLIDAVRLAGGLTPHADTSKLNLSLVISANQLIVIPKMDHVSSSPDQININTANQTQLMSLPGIGESKAQKIIQYRLINGPFKNLEDIQKVAGIGEEIFNKIKPFICIY